MSTTLHEHPPHQLAEQAAPRFDTRRPTALDRLALRLGLLLITYGRRRYAPSREAHSLRHANVRARHARELGWERAHRLQLPPR